MKRILLALLVLMIAMPALAVAPPTPTNLTVEDSLCAYDLAAAHVRWTPSPGAVKHKLYLDGEYFRTVDLQFGGIADQKYWRVHIPLGETADYTVTALNSSDEESAPTAAVEYTAGLCGYLPTPPPTLNAVAIDCENVQLLWVPGSAGYNGAANLFAYQVYRATEDLMDVFGYPYNNAWLIWHWNPPAGVPAPVNFFTDSDDLIGVNPYRSATLPALSSLEGEQVCYKIMPMNQYGMVPAGWATSPVACLDVPPCP